MQTIDRTTHLRELRGYQLAGLFIGFLIGIPCGCLIMLRVSDPQPSPDAVQGTANIYVNEPYQMVCASNKTGMGCAHVPDVVWQRLHAQRDSQAHAR